MTRRLLFPICLFLTLGSCRGLPNYMNCDQYDKPWAFWRRCCESSELPFDCECFDNTFTDFTNSGPIIPQCPEDLGFTAWLYRGSPDSGPTQISAGGPFTDFDNTLDTRVVGHGFQSTSLVGWPIWLKSELLEVEDMNVILVDYAMAVEDVTYLRPVANCRSVGAMIGRLLNDLNTMASADPSTIHLIGHSLGAHIMGYAAVEFERQTGLKIGRITGMDPAGPAFRSVPDSVLLDRTDATFEDIIHTNTKTLPDGGFGITEATGHVDFYVNGGETQPGCPTGSLLNMLLFHPMEIFCSHGRAVTLLVNSVSDCQYDPDTSSESGCTMGFGATADCQGAMSVTTTENYPYC